MEAGVIKWGSWGKGREMEDEEGRERRMREREERRGKEREGEGGRGPCEVETEIRMVCPQSKRTLRTMAIARI